MAANPIPGDGKIGSGLGIAPVIAVFTPVLEMEYSEVNCELIGSPKEFESRKVTFGLSKDIFPKSTLLNNSIRDESDLMESGRCPK